MQHNKVRESSLALHIATLMVQPHDKISSIAGHVGALFANQWIKELVWRLFIRLLQMLCVSLANVCFLEGTGKTLYWHKFVRLSCVCPVLCLVFVGGDLLQEVCDALARWQLEALQERNGP